MAAALSKEQWIERLGLQEHPEGGHYAETFRSARRVVPEGSASGRGLSTAIHYLLGSTSIGQFSAWHRLDGLEESWYYHYGDDLRIYTIDAAGILTQFLLGAGPKAQLQVHVPANVWFCAAVDNTRQDAYTLVSCAVQPGFDFLDFELARRDALTASFPDHRDIIERFTR